jgi:hypothetical protein
MPGRQTDHRATMRSVATPHPATREYRNELVRIAELTVLEDVIHDVRFVNCEIVGPAVLGLIDNVTISGCGFDAPGSDALFWPLPASRGAVMGAVGLANVEILSCRFRRIGLAIPEERLPEMIEAFGFGGD